MSITVDIVGVGPVEFPDGMTKEQMETALKKLPAPNRVTPTTIVPSDKSNYVVGDVPSVVGQYVKPTLNVPEEKVPLMDKIKGVAEVPLTIGSSAIAQTVGPAYGVISNVLSPEFGTQKGIQQGENVGGALANALTYRPRSQTGQNIIQNVSEMVDASKAPPYLGKIGIGELPSFTAAKQVYKPFLQEAATNVVQTAQPVVNKMAEALRSTEFAPKAVVASAPTAENLALEANRLYGLTKQSNTTFNPVVFGNEMNKISKDLREFGYHPKLHPDVKIALDELKNIKTPKDMVELQSLREFITNAQSSQKPKERMIATVLKDKFDDYILNAPDSAIKSGNPQGIETWKQARDVYSKMRKSEIFTNMFEKAEIDKAGIGVQKSLTNQLRSLAKNDKKMRLFSPEEQEAIKIAAQGGRMENLATAIGKFAPTNTVSAIPSILATAASAPLGMAATAGAIGSKLASTKMTKSKITKLAALMRSNQKITKETEKNSKGAK